MVRIVVLVVVVFVAGCATMESGRALDAGAVASLEPGVATRAQVEALLGPPMHIIERSDGSTVISYAHIVSSGHAFGGATAKSITAAFVFDADGVLQSKSSGGNDVRSGR